MDTKKYFHFKEFCNLDSSPDAEFLINSMDIMHSLGSIQSIKAQAIRLMQLQQGDVVLEAGCGHGEDAESMAQYVAPNGSVIAIDISQKMIDGALNRSKLANIQYLLMSASDIKFPNNTFSACHADRLFVSSVDYMGYLDEMIRVTKPGGAICITDVDALSIVIL